MEEHKVNKTKSMRKNNHKIMKRILYIILLFTFLINYACNSLENEKVDNFVESSYSKCKGKSKCIIDFKELFDYDKLYVFGVGITNEEVSKTIGFEYKGDKDISRLILFVKNNQIKYEQNIVFDPDSNPFKFVIESDKDFFNNTIKFNVKKDIERDVYVLKPLE